MSDITNHQFQPVSSRDDLRNTDTFSFGRHRTVSFAALDLNLAPVWTMGAMPRKPSHFRASATSTMSLCEHVETGETCEHWGLLSWLAVRSPTIEIGSPPGMGPKPRPCNLAHTAQLAVDNPARAGTVGDVRPDVRASEGDANRERRFRGSVCRDPLLRHQGPGCRQTKQMSSSNRAK